MTLQLISFTKVILNILTHILYICRYVVLYVHCRYQTLVKKTNTTTFRLGGEYYVEELMTARIPSPSPAFLDNSHGSVSVGGAKNSMLKDYSQ